MGRGGGGVFRLQKKLWTFGPQFGLKIRGGPGPSLDPPLIRNSIAGGSLHLPLLLFCLFILITEIFSIRLSVAIEENRK